MPTSKSVVKKLRLRRGPITPKAVSDATAEVRKTSMRAIEDATGRTWGARALASWQAALEAKAAGREAEFLEHYAHAITFRDESIEHAASGQKGTLAALERQLREIPY